MHWVLWISASNSRQLFNIPPSESIEMECSISISFLPNKIDTIICAFVGKCSNKISISPPNLRLQSMYHKMLMMVWMKDANSIQYISIFCHPIWLPQVCLSVIPYPVRLANGTKPNPQDNNNKYDYGVWVSVCNVHVCNCLVLLDVLMFCYCVFVGTKSMHKNLNYENSTNWISIECAKMLMQKEFEGVYNFSKKRLTKWVEREKGKATKRN